jgi:hypothetical protein
MIRTVRMDSQSFKEADKECSLCRVSSVMKQFCLVSLVPNREGG